MHLCAGAGLTCYSKLKCTTPRALTYRYVYKKRPVRGYRNFGPVMHPPHCCSSRAATRENCRELHGRNARSTRLLRLHRKVHEQSIKQIDRWQAGRWQKYPRSQQHDCSGNTEASVPCCLEEKGRYLRREILSLLSTLVLLGAGCVLYIRSAPNAFVSVGHAAALNPSGNPDNVPRHGTGDYNRALGVRIGCSGDDCLVVRFPMRRESSAVPASGTRTERYRL